MPFRPALPVKLLDFVICIQTIERLWARLKEWRAVAIDGLERWQSSTQQFRQVSLTHLSIISCRVLEEEVVILGRLGAREVELGHRGLVVGGF